ncbi:hypothetical protein PG991_009680 [Apiospora marii]|uniref:Uncharacterized protein n=1 Tax=Apiospora marii TaxID=335849 RepID=A0ABR1RHH3_9PEZI
MSSQCIDPATAIGWALATYVVFWAILYITQDSREPQLLMSSVPFVSPILGMIRGGMDFYAQMRCVLVSLCLIGTTGESTKLTTIYYRTREKHHGLPIYTLRLPGTRIYAINSLDLIPVVQREWRTLIFAPIQVQAAQAAMGVSKATIAIMNRDLVSEKGFVNGMAKATHPSMNNGPSLDRLNGEAFRVFNRTLEQIESDSAGNIAMFKWVERQVMLATTDAVYGPASPMRDSRNLDAWQ